MKGLEKLTSMRLAEVLNQKGIVPPETITDALYVQDKHSERFVDVLVDSGGIAEWDLARVVVESFQLPFMLAGGYSLSDAARARIPEQELFENLLVPLDLFDDVLTVSMPVLTTAEVLVGLQRKYKVEIYPYVGLISENKKVLQDEFTSFKEWMKAHLKDKERRIAEVKRAEARRSSGKGEAGGDDWANLFDSGERAVQQDIHKKH